MHYENSEKENLKDWVDAALTLPDRRNFENPNLELPRKLGAFLVEAEQIQNMKVWEGSWGMKYSNTEKAVYLNDKPMPHESFNHYFFRLGKNSRGKNLFPDEGEEADRYRILHEVSHAYQFLCIRVASGIIESWYADFMDNKFGRTALDQLIQLCLYIRMTKPSGITTWGNQPSYHGIMNKDVNLITRALEDANELATMALWHPDYFEQYLSYLAGQIPGYTTNQVLADGLQPITIEQKQNFQRIMADYISTMKEVIHLNS